MKKFSDERLNELALALRRFAEKQAVIENTVYWKILRNKVIVSICKNLPTSIKEFSTKGVLIGKKKLEKYGPQIVEIVCRCLEDGQEPTAQDIAAEWGTRKQPDGIMIIKQAGFYYSVSGNDALILHKYFGYKLYGKNILRTGFPVAGEKKVLRRLDNLSINYDLLDKVGNVVVSKRFENNLYEIISMREAAAMDEEQSIKVQPTKMSSKEKMAYYIGMLNGLSEGVNVITGEMVDGLDPEIKSRLLEISKYFEQRLRLKEKQEVMYPQQGQRWTEEEDEQLLSEYHEGQSIKEISEIHNRSQGAIRSRLLSLGVLSE